MVRIIVLAALAVASCEAFAPAWHTTLGSVSKHTLNTGVACRSTGDFGSRSGMPLSMTADRRDALVFSGLALAGLALGPQEASATAAAPTAETAEAVVAAAGAGGAALGASSSPVAVIGPKGGNLGSELVASLVRRQLPVRPVYRTARRLPLEPPGAEAAARLADVTDPKSLTSALKGSSAVVYAVSAPRRTSDRREGTESDMGTTSLTNTPDAIYNRGLRNVARACIENNIPRLVVVGRSGCTQNPSIASGEVCTTEISGEEIMRDMYREANTKRDSTSQLAYTVARAGTLISGIRRGPVEAELNQGDTLSGFISRPDLADLIVEMLATGSGKMSTFEAFYKDTANPTNFVKSLETCIESGRTFSQCSFGDDNIKPPSLSEIASGKGKAANFNMEMGIQTGIKGSSWTDMLSKLTADELYNVDLPAELGVQSS